MAGSFSRVASIFARLSSFVSKGSLGRVEVGNPVSRVSRYGSRYESMAAMDSCDRGIVKGVSVRVWRMGKKGVNKRKAAKFGLACVSHASM